MMRKGFFSVPLLLCLLMIGSAFVSTPARADQGVLKLMVLDCETSEPIDGAVVDVIIWRPGVGEIDSASGETADGYVEFTFDGLQDDDKAHVTVTPEGHDPDPSHCYYWVKPPKDAGAWDLGVLLDSFGQCGDGWWDKDNGIFSCLYSEPGQR
jgi:hypothetical protein